MNKTLKVGVIGVGFIGEFHARIWNQLPQSELISVSDIDVKKAKKIAEKYNCKYYENYEDQLRDSPIDAVDICVPATNHLQPALASAKAKKDILLEKPFANSYEETEIITKAVQENKVRLMVAHSLRFDPRYVNLFELIKKGELGDPVHVKMKRYNPRTCLYRLTSRELLLHYLGIHDIDAMNWFVGSEITRIYAQSTSIVHKSKGIEDAVFAIMNFKNGAVGSLELSWALPATMPSGIYANVEFVGTKGAGFLEIPSQILSVYGEEGMISPDVLHWAELYGSITGVLKDEIEHFCSSILNKTEFAVSTNDAAKAIKVVDCILESIHTGKPIDLKN